MRVAWDLQAVTGPGRTGLGVSVQLLLDALRAHAPDIEVCGLPPNRHDQPLRGVPERIAWEQFRLPAQVAREHRRGSLALCYSPALGAPLRCAVPVMAHVHDLIPLRYPALFQGAAGWYWRRLLPTTWRRCARLTVSNRSVANELRDVLGYAPERISVVPYYADPAVREAADRLRPGWESALDAAGPDPPVFLTLGTHEPRKNVAAAIRALAWIRRRGVPARLVCAGGHTSHSKELQRAAEQAGVRDAVEFPGYLTREDTVRLLLGATALVFPSLYEGYGMPPQEAQSVGCAVVLSDIACHREVYADRARWATMAEQWQTPPALIPPADETALGQAMLRLVEDAAYRTALRRSGLAYSRTFTAEATAQALRAAFIAVSKR